MKMILVVAASAALATPSVAAELLVNGDFEAGTFAGWSSNTQSGSFGNRSIDTPGTTTPLASFPTAANPSGGNFYAVTSQINRGAYSMTQGFTLASGTTSAMLTFQMFNRNTEATTIINPAGLVYNAGPNQHARVDILTAGAGAFSVAPGDIVANLYLGSGPGTGIQPYASYSFNLLSLGLAAGNSYQVRFGQVDNQGFYNQGVDNVSILATAVPEPTSWLMMIAGFGLVGATVRRSRSVQASIAAR